MMEEIILIELLDRTMHTLKRLIYRNCAYWHWRSVDNRRAHLIEVDAAGGESITVSAPYFTASAASSLPRRRQTLGGTDVGVHLALAGDADRHRLRLV